MCSTSSRDVLYLSSSDRQVIGMGDMQTDLRDLIARNLPGYDVRSIVSMGEGLDNVSFLVNGELVVRQSKFPDANAIRREVTVLEIVGRCATLPVPRITFADPDAGLLAYRKLPGTPLLDMAVAHRPAIAGALGEFLHAIHSIPLAEVGGIVPREDEPLQEWLDEARAAFAEISPRLPASARQRIESFLRQSPPAEPPRFTFCHNDFGAEHILIDPGTSRITGIIDWTDAAIADPVRDLALILRDLGPDALDRALESYGTDLTPDDHARLVFHARCKLIEDLAFGIQNGLTRYVDASRAHLDWTFHTTSIQ
jgi:aminoglycoside phosphotransferase (APT) family kinase protein